MSRVSPGNIPSAVARPPRITAARASVAPRPGRSRGAGRFPFHEIPWGKVLAFVALVAAVGLLLKSQLDVHEVHRQADRMPAGVAFGLLTVLPLIGFPASVLHVAAGIRFGAGLGLALVSLSIGIQLLASFAIVRVWHSWFERSKWIGRIRKRIPNGAHTSICLFAVVLPGAPYAGINYALPLLGVPLRTYLLCCLPIHTLRSTVTVVLGDQSDQLTPGRLLVLLAYAAMILGMSWWMYRRLRRQYADPQPAAGDPKQPG